MVWLFDVSCILLRLSCAVYVSLMIYDEIKFMKRK